jgi:hypothetical protein
MQLAAADAPGEQAQTYGAARRIVSTVLADLCDLAHGIHPAALTDDGLMTGLRTLANRSPVPLNISGAGPVTRSAVADAAAYRLVAYTAHAAGRLDRAPVRPGLGGRRRGHAADPDRGRRPRDGTP